MQSLRVCQIQQHLGVDGDNEDGRDDFIDDEAYDVDTNMTQEQVRLFRAHTL